MLTTRLSIAIVTVAALTACGAKKKSTTTADASSSSTIDQTKTVEASVALQLDESSGLALLGATVTGTGTVSGCISGYSKAFDQTTASVPVVLNDKRCVAKLSTVAVSYNGADPITYTIAPTFSHAAGASFVASSGSNPQIVLTVLSQLPAAIVASPLPQISFRVASIAQAAATAAQTAASSATVSLAVADPVNYQIPSITVDVDSATGGGAFHVKLHCLSVVSDTGICGSAAQTAVKAAIVRDSYSPTALTLAQCLPMTAAANAKAFTTVIAPSTEKSGPNGGGYIDLVGPSSLCAAANANLILAIADGSGSCLWSKVAVTCP